MMTVPNSSFVAPINWKADDDGFRISPDGVETLSWFEEWLGELKNRTVVWYDVTTWYNDSVLYFKFGSKTKLSVGSFGTYLKRGR